jgi:type VI secretion system protein ImpL
MTIWLLRIFSAIALLGFAVAVWFAGPLIGFAETRPLEPVWVRATVIGVVVAMVAGYYLFGFFQMRNAQKALEAAIAKTDDRDSDSRVLEARMNEAVATLKRSNSRRNFLYELPWYIVIGPPGVGKTTALVSSGLKFPLAGSGEAQPVAGVGGTRYCDWWFTDDAVLIDTAGRYTTQDSDTETDKKSWLAFLSLLKKHRVRQPINGVILAISLSDLMTLSGQDLGAHTVEIRNRLHEIHEILKIEFPVYVLFTKADLISGFMEYFDSFDENRRRKVWGITFQIADRSKNMVEAAPAEFDALVKRLSSEVMDRLHEEADPVARISIFGFPAQFSSLNERITDFLGRVFEPTRKQANASLRGLYFSSGTQEGTPIDQVLGSIGRSFGSSAQAHLSGTGKSFFLHDLLTKVIFAESGWVSHDRSAERRTAIVRYGSFAAIALVAATVLAALGLSFATNRALVASTDQTVEQYRVTADPLLKSATVSDVDLENVIGALDTLRNLPVGYENRELPTPIEATLGLSQRERLVSASSTAYRQALERMFRSRLLLQVERTIEANMGDPLALYEPLKIYLMLGGKAPKADNDLIVSWMKQDWEQNRYPGAQNRAGREELEKHLRAMLALDDAHDPLFELNRPLVESAQRSLGRMTVADRAFALVKSAIYSAALDDFSVSVQGGPEAPLIFETVDGSDLSTLTVPGLYTHAGFNDFYLAQLGRVAQKLVDDQWVIGAGGEQGGFEQELLRLGPELLDRYGKEFAAAWTTILDKLKFKAMSADKPQYVALSAAASPTSPISQLFEAIAYETALTREAEAGEDPQPPSNGSAASTVAGTVRGRGQNAEDRAKGLARIGIDAPTRKSQSRAGAAFAKSAGQNPGASIEAQFKPFQILVSGPPGQRPIDALIQNFRDIYQSLTLSAAMPSQTERVNANRQLQISNLRANASRLPKALSKMVHAAADDFEGDAAETSIAQLNKMLEETVRRPCEEVTANRFPFAGSSAEDVPMVDFAKLFAPNGVIDRFFAQNLSPLADTTGQNWQWKQDTRLGRDLSKSALKEFQLAAEIRDAFFPLGGSVPAINITFTPFSLHGQADMALLDVNGQIVQSYQTGSTPGMLTWPGGLDSGSANLSLTPELPGRESTIKFEGPWALKRLLDSGSVTRNGDNLEVRFVIGGRDVAYAIQIGSIGNPFSLPALSGFSCPKGF